MKAGKLRHRVILQRLSAGDDGYGGITEIWQEVAVLWAQVEPLRGNERYRAQAITAELSHKVTIRYRKNVVPQMRLVIGEQILNIQAVIDPEERHVLLELLCSEEGV